MNKIGRLKESKQWAKDLPHLAISRGQTILLKGFVKLSLETYYFMVNNLNIHRHLRIMSLA